eukprot:1294553-Pleurochrysis_carterae.AAC.1
MDYSSYCVAKLHANSEVGMTMPSYIVRCGMHLIYIFHPRLVARQPGTMGIGPITRSDRIFEIAPGRK